MNRALRASIAALSILVLSASALAGPEVRTHDGFFLRLSLGGGGSSSEVDYIDGSGFDETLTVSGATGDVNIAIGAMVASSTALHATIFGFSIEDPELEFDSIGSGADVNGSYTVANFGVGLTQFFMPSNLYLSASVGVASMELDVDGAGKLESDSGVAFDLTLGKEWWVSDNWGLGVAGGLQLARIEDEDGDDWKCASLALRFSATFN